MNTDRYNGTTSLDMSRSINYWIDESWYVAKAENNSTNLWAKLKFATDYQHPANILVDTKYLSGYNGKSVNHFLTARGYSKDTDGTNKKIHLVDPHYSSTYTGYHNYEPYNNVYSAVNAQSWHENTRLIVELEEK